MDQLIERAKNIKCLICDLDGVLTDGLLYLGEQKNEFKAFHIHDGVGLKLLMAAGIEVAIITGSTNPLVDHRMHQLGIIHYYKNKLNKQQTYEELKKTLNLQDKQFAYIGDDLPDAAIMQQVGLSVAVANAVKQIKAIASWQTSLPGGSGAVREVCDLILSAQNKMDLALTGYLAS